MTAVEAYCGGQRIPVKDARDMITRGDSVGPTLRMLATAAAVCNEARFEGAATGGDRAINGQATDAGLLRFGDALGDADADRRAWNEVYRLAFNSSEFCERVDSARLTRSCRE